MIPNAELLKKLNEKEKKYLYGITYDYMTYRLAYYNENLTVDEAMTKARENMKARSMA